MIIRVVALLSLVVVVACAARCQTTAPSSGFLTTAHECGAGCYRYVPDDEKCYRVVACDSEGAHGAYSQGECLEICQ